MRGSMGEQGKKIMLNYAILCFAIGAVGGLVLAASVLRGKLAPWALSLVHAGLGAAGLVLTLMVVLSGSEGAIRAGFAALVVAALGGFYLASYHYRGQVAPKQVVVIHALVAVVGFLTLVASSLSLA